MSYNPAISELQLQSAQPIALGDVFVPAPQPGVAIWTYDAVNDTASDYLTAGYFVGAYFRRVREGDLVVVKDRMASSTTLNEVYGFSNLYDASIAPISGGGSGGISALIGDVSAAGTGVVTATLAAVATAGSFTNANITIDAKGRVLVAANGSTSSYVLPPATTTTLGGVKVGSGLAVTGDGTISSSGGGYTLPPATTTTLGGVKVGSGLAVAGDGTITATGSSGGNTIIQVASTTLLTTNTTNTYSNSGASGTVVMTLPTAALNLEFAAYIGAAQILEFLAVGTDAIRNGSDVSVAAGNIQSNTVGNYLKIKCMAAGIWSTTSILGDWTLT